MAAVEEMAHKQGVDWVMVELTGLADPGTSSQFYTGCDPGTRARRVGCQIRV
jgi:G3E family GTPase